MHLSFGLCYNVSMKIITTHPDIKENPYFGRGDAILDITASGRYWRTSRLRSVTLLTCGRKITWLSEKESDEPDILEALSHALSGKGDTEMPVGHIITFNGHAFDLPHLHRKYAAYALLDPLNGRSYTDLFLTYSHLKDFLGLPSRRLIDYADFAGADPRLDDADRTLAILPLRAFTDALNGIISPSGESDNPKPFPSLVDSFVREGRLYYTLGTDYTFPRLLSIHDTVFHLQFSDHLIKISAPIEDGTLRVYHTDIKNYFYLPAEGYAVHKAAAAYVDKSRKEKAVRENCFHRAVFRDLYLTDCGETRQYIRSIVSFLLTPRRLHSVK